MQTGVAPVQLVMYTHSVLFTQELFQQAPSTGSVPQYEVV
jgi:hypothetical protein